MANKVSKVIPVAERIIEFGTKDIRENDGITSFSEDLISEKGWSEFAKNALLIVDGRNIIQYAEEYPIVCYKRSEIANAYGASHLNSFIKSITVSTAMYGKKACFDTGKLSCKNTDYDTVVYYTNNVGINYAIMQQDICKVLLQKPRLVVSPEGVLVFFTDKQIVATVDCNNCYEWIDGHYIEVRDKTIKNIEVCEDYSKVTLLDDDKVEHNFSLKFDLDATLFRLLNIKYSEL